MNQDGHLARDCQNPTTTCRYCRAVDHVIEQCPQLIAKIQENNSGPTQTIQLISVEQRPTAAINVVTRSGARTQIQHLQKQPVKVCARKAPAQVPTLNTAQDQVLGKVAPCDIVDPRTPAVHAQQPP